MANKIKKYQTQLSSHRDKRLFLLRNSGLPGKRANVELAKAFAKTAGQSIIYHWAGIPASEAPKNSPHEFLAYCGVLGLGRLAAEGKEKSLDLLRASASDERWRIREAVVMALQTIGQHNFNRLLDIADEWSTGNFYEQRAAVASINEPGLLNNPAHSYPVLSLMDLITDGLASSKDNKEPGYNVLKKALGYTWSIAVSAYPEEGKPVFEQWVPVPNPDIRWIIKQNLKKKRLQIIDPEWVKSLAQKIKLEPPE